MGTAAMNDRGYVHVDFDAHGVPIIAGTTMKVIELVLAQAAHGWSPEELHLQFPHLSLGQIHSALGYYWDHKQTLDEDIRRRLRRVERMQREAGPSKLKADLQARGLIE